MIVVDASPLIVLAKIGRLSLLKGVYGQIIIGPWVKREVIDRGRVVDALGVKQVETGLLAEWICEVRPTTTVRKLLHRAIQEWKREYYARQYGEGRMTLAKAAKEAGVTLWELIDYVRQRKIAAQYDLDDLRKDVQSVLSGLDTPGRAS